MRQAAPPIEKRVEIMPNGHKIAIFGVGSIGRLVWAGTAALTFCEMKNKKSDFDFDISALLNYRDYTSLVKSYKKVQRKYYPEKDLLLKGAKEAV
jgi:hypothetical protein